MAVAKKTVSTRIVQKPVTVEITRVILDLNIHEAELLCFLLDRVGGARESSPRKYATTMSTALREAGINPPEYGSESLHRCDGRAVFAFKGDAKTLEGRSDPRRYYDYPESLFSDSTD